ncbi:MAG: AAA family ATPase [Thermoleophilaceae bacterium]|nr:AAA family ATPase [Thermoleophilaceae bacterium]
MKIAVAGKGGAGKTTVSGTVARAVARSGQRVLAVDTDVNPMLGISLGVGVEETERLASVREALQQDDAEHEWTPEGIVERFGSDAPDGVRLVVASRMQSPDSGCMCCGVTPDYLLRELESEGRTVLGDLEAGVGVLSRMDPDNVDIVLVVANPTAKSIEVARRAIETAAALNSRVLVVANRISSDDDLNAISAVAGMHEIVVVPEDPVIVQADKEGRAPLDCQGPAPGIDALLRLGQRLAAT